MAGFRRYAIYAAPEGRLAAFAHGWLGWDAYAGRPRPHPDIAGLPRALAEITETPRKYGFHGTLKAPFRLAPGMDEAALLWAAEAFAARRPPATAPGLRLARLGGFLALVPDGDETAIAALAAAAVEALDAFRAAPTADEIARRNPDRLTARQRVLLDRWGYPHVMEEFRFHLTLTGDLPQPEAEAVEAALAPRLARLLPRPFAIDSLGVFAEAEDGRFHLIRRVPLQG